jgi:hypothetical protein
MKQWRKITAAAVPAFCFAFLISCGSPGPPEPPSLELPRAVTDLRATRKGDKVTLVWTVPTKTTDAQNVRELGPTLICRSLRIAANRCSAVGEVDPTELMPKRVPSKHAPSSPVQVSYVDTLPMELQQQRPLGEINYAVETDNPNRRSAGLSNQVRIPLAPTLPAPSDLKARVTGDGVMLTWAATPPSSVISGLHYLARIYRRDVATKKDAMAGEVTPNGASGGSFTDRSFEWEKNYQYRVAMVTVVGEGTSPVQIEGDDSAPVSVVATDVFPPAVPSGVEAVASGVGQQPFIDLTWPPVGDSDVAGYNVYRREQGQALVKINTGLVKTPAFRDPGVQQGHTYFYSVSAVDLRGNESGRSEEASEAVPSS